MKKRNLPTLGPLSTQFFAYIQMRGKEIFRLGELQSAFKMSAKQERNLLSNLTTKGLIVRLKRGVYLVPKKIPPGGKWQPSAGYMISHLMEELSASYYISGLYAFNYYGLTEQVPNVMTVYNDKLSGQKQLGKLTVRFIKVAKQRLGGTTSQELFNDREIKVATLTRTIVDAFIDWRRYNTLPAAYEWIKRNLDVPNFLQELISVTIKYGNISTRRRIGYYLYQLGQNDRLVKSILKTLKRTQGWVLLDPYSKTKGITNKTWGIIDNVGEHTK